MKCGGKKSIFKIFRHKRRHFGSEKIHSKRTKLTEAKNKSHICNMEYYVGMKSYAYEVFEWH